jgi:hypothetical protein
VTYANANIWTADTKVWAPNGECDLDVGTFATTKVTLPSTAATVTYIHLDIHFTCGPCDSV